MAESKSKRKGVLDAYVLLIRYDESPNADGSGKDCIGLRFLTRKEAEDMRSEKHSGRTDELIKLPFWENAREFFPMMKLLSEEFDDGIYMVFCDALTIAFDMGKEATKQEAEKKK